MKFDTNTLILHEKRSTLKLKFNGLMTQNEQSVPRVKRMHTFLEKIRGLPPIREGYTRFYRGQRADWPLVPQLYREGVSYHKYESQIFYKVTAELPSEFSDSRTIFDHLVKMQHYSIPTRLLDITTNPLIALFFACEKDDIEPRKGRRPDGSIDPNPYVYVFDINNSVVKQRDSDGVTVLSALAKYDGTLTETEYSQALKGDYFKDSRFLHIIREDKPYFRDMIKKETLSSILCVQPKLDNPRIIRQSGAFLIFGIEKARCRVASLEDDQNIIINKIKIDRHSKDEIRRDLESVNISSASLFFDLDHLADRVKELYTD